MMQAVDAGCIKAAKAPTSPERAAGSVSLSHLASAGGTAGTSTAAVEVPQLGANLGATAAAAGAAGKLERQADAGGHKEVHACAQCGKTEGTMHRCSACRKVRYILVRTATLKHCVPLGTMQGCLL